MPLILETGLLLCSLEVCCLNGVDPATTEGVNVPLRHFIPLLVVFHLPWATKVATSNLRVAGAMVCPPAISPSEAQMMSCPTAMRSAMISSARSCGTPWNLSSSLIRCSSALERSGIITPGFNTKYDINYKGRLCQFLVRI